MDERAVCRDLKIGFQKVDIALCADPVAGRRDRKTRTIFSYFRQNFQRMLRDGSVRAQECMIQVSEDHVLPSFRIPVLLHPDVVSPVF